MKIRKQNKILYIIIFKNSKRIIEEVNTIEIIIDEFDIIEEKEIFIIKTKQNVKRNKNNFMKKKKNKEI